MDEIFKIYIDRLSNGQREVIRESISPEFMDIHESDLAFKAPVELQGEVYTADDTLILHFSISTIATIPCNICNTEVPYKINIPNFYHSDELNEIKSGIFNFKDLLRETILIELPMSCECNNGCCPERKTLAKYINKNKEKGAQETYHPFADL